MPHTGRCLRHRVRVQPPSSARRWTRSSTDAVAQRAQSSRDYAGYAREEAARLRDEVDDEPERWEVVRWATTRDEAEAPDDDHEDWTADGRVLHVLAADVTA